MQRRSFLQASALLGAGLFIDNKSLFAFDKLNSKFGGVQMGVITYSYRSLPGSAEQILQYCVDSGVSAIELMGDAAEDFAGAPSANKEVWKTLKAPERNKQMAAWRETTSMDKFHELKKMYNKAGVSIYAFKPDALSERNTDGEIEYALKAAKALGANSVTVELQKPEQSKRLGEIAAKHKVYIGYHAHTQATDTAWDLALSQSPYNSMNLDCGHYIAAGGANTKETLLALIEAKHDRITSMHMKDRLNKDHGSANKPWGEGDTPIKEILSLLKEKKYKIPATVELEYEVPKDSDPVKEVRKCIAFAKNILA
jgi:sugar phosphate isomerase/epimerase